MEILNIFTPQTLTEVLQLLNNNEKALLLAGGTDLILDLKKGNKAGKSLISLNKVEELNTITDTGDEVIIGSMVTFAELLSNKIIQKNFPAIYQCAQSMGSPQIRNLATVGGNIINGAPAADIVPCIISLNGSLVIESQSYIRNLGCETYFTDYQKEKITDKEILTKIIIPKRKQLSGFYKLGKRNSLAIARINTAICIVLKDKLINSLSICLGAVGRFPFKVELDYQGKPLEWLSSEAVLENLENAVYESIKTRKTMPFKKEAVKGVYKKALENALSGVKL